MTPASPYCVYIHSFSDIDDELDVGIIVVVRATRNLESVSFTLCFESVLLVQSYLNELICHSDVICVRSQIFRSSHHSELDGPLVAECFVGPFSYGSDLFDRSNAVVGD